MSYHDRAGKIKIMRDLLTCSGEKGYRMARASHGLMEGDYYYEIKVRLVRVPNMFELWLF
jgi:Set1/Ash2 histone methyltransferase complex subunit ASH2